MNTLINLINAGLIFLLSKPLRKQKPEKPENKVLTELQSLKVSLDKIKKIKAIHILNIGMFIIRLDYPNHNNNHNTLPRGCSSC